jgi:uncharacterized protein (TIGR00299 family) protein
MKTLYFDCFSGASGNMILGALFGLGVTKDQITAELRKLSIPDFEIRLQNVDRSGIASLHAEVIVPSEHTHRHLTDILGIIQKAELSERVKNWSAGIFTSLAEAEAKVHGIAVEKVHFHEVGGLDAIIDVVGSCIGFELLGVERFICSRINVGSGFIEMEHGKFPVPPPAVAELLRDVPIYSTEVAGELITPTGAAIISTLCDSYGAIPQLTVEYVSYGAGTRTYERFPNVLRLMLGTIDEVKAGDNDSLVLLETNLDDLSPQVLGYVMERAFELKALDCWFTPIQMKKNRPATMISILCRPPDKATLSELLYSETTTLGIRVRNVERECISREVVKVSTAFGNIDVKIARYDGRVVNAMPEYDQVRAAAMSAKAPFRIVSDAAIAALKKLVDLRAARI